MTTAQTAGNPFALMLDPEAVFAALACSDRLGRLKSRICRPLDKPLIAHADAEESASEESDLVVDVAMEQFGV